MHWRGKAKTLPRGGALIPRSKRHAAGKDKPVVIAVEVRCSDLHSSSKYQPESVLRILAKFDPAHHQSWSQKSLILPVVRAAVIVAGVCLKLRPEIFPYLVL